MPDSLSDEHEPVDQLPPKEDVFSYFMLAAPLEKKRHSTFTWDAAMSYMLVLLTLCIQGVLLLCVYDKVVLENVDWQSRIFNFASLKDGEDWNVVQNLQASGSRCNDGKSLCMAKGGTISCAPPTVQLTGRWNELDLDQDGIWTREEVMTAREDLRCKYAVDPVEVFDVFVEFLKSRDQVIWIHPDIKHGKAIYKPYFNFAMGDILMCGYRNQDMCGNLLKRGVFTAPLKYNTSARVGNTIASALDYCRALLEPRGMCERFLPSTYSTWKIESVVQCQRPKYKQFVYTHPSNGVTKSLLSVDYKARQRYARAQTPLFMIYKGCIVGLWILLITSFFREVLKISHWVVSFPEDIEHVEEDVEATRPNALGKTKKRRDHLEKVKGVNGISTTHRAVLIIVTMLRAVMLTILLYVGLSFLGRQTDYIGLLLDGVALIFIIEVAEIVYARVLREEVRALWGQSDPMLVGRFYAFKYRPDVADMIWFVIVMAAATLYIWYYTKVLVDPLYESLECSCVVEGEKCLDAQRFSASFWDNYWRHVVPNSLEQIDTLHHAEAASMHAVRAMARRVPIRRIG
jgi:hypothetical protein